MKTIINCTVSAIMVLLVLSCNNAPTPESVGKQIFEYVKNIEKKSLKDYAELFMTWQDVKGYSPKDFESQFGFSEQEMNELLEAAFLDFKEDVLDILEQPAGIKFIDFIYEKADISENENIQYEGELYFTDHINEPICLGIRLCEIGNRLKVIDYDGPYLDCSADYE